MERNAYHEQLEDTIVHLRAENKRLTAYARELQERISTLVNENERLMDSSRDAGTDPRTIGTD
jgi:predicted RNase H-like nuclease (RuvC/YqgF family)